MATTLTINRAPVLTLWAAIVAERLGHDRDAARTLGKAVAGLNAQSKGRRLGVFAEAPKEGVAKPARARAAETESLLGREVPVAKSHEGLRALERGAPMDPAVVQRYLEQKFGDALPEVEAAFRALARSRTPTKLAAEAFALYEHFRPAIPEGRRGWGAAGVLDLGLVARLAKPKG